MYNFVKLDGLRATTNCPHAARILSLLSSRGVESAFRGTGGALEPIWAAVFRDLEEADRCVTVARLSLGGPPVAAPKKKKRQAPRVQKAGRVKRKQKPSKAHDLPRIKHDGLDGIISATGACGTHLHRMVKYSAYILAEAGLSGMTRSAFSERLGRSKGTIAQYIEILREVSLAAPVDPDDPHTVKLTEEGLAYVQESMGVNSK